MTNKRKIKKQTVLGVEINTVLFSANLPLFTEDDFNVRMQITNEEEPQESDEPSQPPMSSFPHVEYNFVTTVTLKKSELSAGFDEEEIKVAALEKAGLEDL